ncbi:MAG: ABC transporter permease [Lachnospiraceae bacterium]|jgi:putative ABC transport system permease protein|nr:ABC transporter permease [Lachnospiraceae bacterium]
MKTGKLAFRNVKRSFRDYVIYFITLSLGVCIFYVFNSFNAQNTLMNLTEAHKNSLKSLDLVMASLSVFITFILGFLMLYANNFLLRRRKKEFGMYMVLGMEPGTISRILITETLFVGLFSLAIGLIFGVLLSQCVCLLTARLLHTQIENFHLVFSASATVRAIIYFGLIFFVTLIFNVLAIGNRKPVSLLYAERKNESHKLPKTGISLVIFLLSVVMLGIGYSKVLTGLDALKSDTLYLFAGLTTLGTFLLFFSLSGFVLKLIQMHPKVYLKNLNMFVARQITSKLNTTWVSLSVVCLMLFVSIATLSSGLGLTRALAASLSDNTPFDASIVVDAGFLDDDSYNTYEGFEIKEALNKAGVDLDTFAKESESIRYYKSPSLTLSMGGERITADTYAVKLSEYNEILSMQGRATLSLSDTQYALSCSFPNQNLKDALSAYVRSGKSITVDGNVKLNPGADAFTTKPLFNATNQSSTVTLILPDAILDGHSTVKDVLNINYKTDSDNPAYSEEVMESLCKEAFSKLYAGEGMRLNLETKASVMGKNDSDMLVISYLAVYVGIVFLIAAAAVLSIRQLSETGDNIGRYALLKKIGAENKMVLRSILTQTGIYFAAPMVLAIFHSIIIISITARIVSLYNGVGILVSALFTAATLLLIYGGYFLATYLGSKTILARDYETQVRGEY